MSGYLKWVRESLRLKEVDGTMEHTRWVNEGKAGESDLASPVADLNAPQIFCLHHQKKEVSSTPAPQV